MNLFCIYAFSLILVGNISNTIGIKIHLLSHIIKNGDTVKLDDVILEELAVDSNMILKTKSANKLLYYSLRKFISIILTFNEPELNEFMDIFLGQMTYKIKYESVEQFKSKLNIMAQRSGFGIKYVLLTWWIYLNDDEELQMQIDTINTIMMIDPLVADTYLDSLKLYKIKGKEMIEYETAGFMKLFTTSDDAELGDILKKISGNIYEHLVVYDDTAEKVLKKPLFKVSKHILTDFLYELVKILIDFENSRLVQFFEMLDIEFRNYKYNGGKFETIFMTKAREDAYNNFIPSFGSDYFTIQQNVKHLKRDMEDALSEKPPFLKIVGILDKTYNISHQEKLDNLIIQVRRYATDDIEISKIVRDVLRLVLFDHVENVSKDIKDMISIIDVPSTNRMSLKSNGVSPQTNETSIQQPLPSTTPKKSKSSKRRHKKEKEEAKRRRKKRKHNKKKSLKEKLKRKKRRHSKKKGMKEDPNLQKESINYDNGTKDTNIRNSNKVPEEPQKRPETPRPPSRQWPKPRTGSDAVKMVPIY